MGTPIKMTKQLNSNRGLVAHWHWDTAGKTIAVDRGFVELTGMSSSMSEDGVGFAEFMEIIHPKDVARVEKELRTAAANKETCESEFRIRSTQYYQKWILSRGSMDAESGVFSGILLEISDRKYLEKELLMEKQKLESRVKERTEQLHLTNQGLRDEVVRRREAEEELKRSNKELEDFAYVASHDLQEPLRKIQAFGDLLETEYKDELGDGSDYLNRIRAASSRMSKLIQDLLTFSRIATKSNPPEPVDLNEILVDVVDDLELRIADTEGTVDVGELPTVMADPTHMRQLFQNLIGNALKFHRVDDAPIVRIEQHTGDENCFEIRVCDNGIGFDRKYVDRIFSVFQRLHGREEYEGTGIGLAVCRKIVEQYDGTITAETKKNDGSTFIITLPKDVALSSIKEE